MALTPETGARSCCVTSVSTYTGDLDVETTPYPVVRSEGTLELQPVTIGVRDVKLRTPQGRSSGIPSGATPLTVRVFIGIRPGQV